jgi:hypothetical protein
MPKARYSSQKGLIQESGTGVDFATDSVGLNSRRKAETLSSVGTVAAPTKTLTAADSGGVFFCDIGTVSVVLQLPTPAAGLNYKIVASTASDNENGKDLMVHTGATSVDMGGNIMVAGAVLEITSATSVILMDSTAGRTTVGDYFYFECDGTDWYISGSVTEASSVVINDTYSAVTPA